MIIHDTQKDQVVFVYKPATPVKKVCVAGDFNGWDPSARRLARFPKDGTYRARLSLAPGRYEYKLVVDGEWVEDAEAQEQTVNPFGTTNSVLVVEPAHACNCAPSCACECTRA
jgi:1,4-alpha-glucan branching enzyme